MSTTGEHHAGRIIVGVFTDREHARDAARQLHDAGYKHTWIGTTRPHGPTDDSRGVESGTLTGEVDGTEIAEGGSGNILGSIGRFFAGEGYTLNEALREHGVGQAEAAQLEQSIAPGSSVLTLTLGDDDVRAGSDDPGAIIERCDGRLLTPEAGLASDEQLGVSEVSQRRAANQSDDATSVREEFFTERRPIPRSASQR